MLKVIDYIKGSDIRGSIIQLEEKSFRAVTGTMSKSYKTERGARAFMERNGYIEVADVKMDTVGNVVEVVELEKAEPQVEETAVETTEENMVTFKRSDLKVKAVLRNSFIPVGKKGVEIEQVFGVIYINLKGRTLPQPVQDKIEAIAKKEGVFIEYSENGEFEDATNSKRKIIRAVSSRGCRLGIYDKAMDDLSRSQLNKVIDHIGHGSTKVDIVHNRVPYIVDISEADGKVDFRVLSKAEYINIHGDGRWDD